MTRRRTPGGRPWSHRGAPALAGLVSLAGLFGLAGAEAAADPADGPRSAGQATADSALPAADDRAASGDGSRIANAPWGGELRLRRDDHGGNAQGPLAAAHRASPGLAVPAPDSSQLELALHGHWSPQPGLQLAGDVLAWQTRPDGQPAQGHGQVNELQLSAEHGAWAASAGKKVVAWDVGYGFRPNDLVQQETRRTLLSAPLEGRPLLQLEHFGADRAATLVWVNPQRLNAAADNSRGAGESALAARVYQRHGGDDWFGFARLGRHSGASLGLATAQVVGDALEWHASARLLQRHDGWQQAGGAAPGVNPWHQASSGGTGQWLVGGQWTGDSQHSLMLEWWHDGSTPSAGQWRDWQQRNQALAARLALPAAGGPPPQAIAGQLAWQATPLAGPGLQRDNLYLRWAWQPERWTLAADALINPADRGALLGASLRWQGDRWRLDAAWRGSAGASRALVRQLPQARNAVLAATLAF